MVDIHVQVEMYGGGGYIRSGAYMVDIHVQVEMYGGRGIHSMDRFCGR
jgi:hypothetical protein